MKIIDGITWDHPRGYNPLVAGGRAFAAIRPDVEVRWSRRSLSAFGEQPIEELTRRYDILVIDHPFCGTAAATGCLLDLAPIISKSLQNEFDRDSVGPSTESYRFLNALWALPTDATAQVAAYRPELMAEIDAELPKSMAQTLELAACARAKGKWIGLTLGPTDAACTLLSLFANLGGGLDEQYSVGIDRKVFEESLHLLAQLAAAAHPMSLTHDPISLYEAMSSNDEIVYVPYAFGYSNYSRKGGKLRYTNVAGPGRDPERGALLGGAGCAISSSCKDIETVVQYLEFIHGRDHQRGIYFDHDGQPGRRSVWEDERVNAASSNYFRDTLPTLTKAYRRPRHHGFVPFLKEFGEALNTWLRFAGSPTALVDRTVRAYDESFGRPAVVA